MFRSRFLWSKIIISTIVLMLVFGVFATLFTQKVLAASLPAGGTTIDSAVVISAGSYSVGALVEKENHYYSIGVKAGQELTVTGKFKVLTENEQYGTLDTIELYDSNKESLVSSFDDAGSLITVSTLASSEKTDNIYFIRISDDTWGTESGELTVTLTDRFDANSGTDAGQKIESALAISSGSYKGYFSQVDIDDYYAISAKKGAFSVKLTPEAKTSPTVKIFDSNRKELASETAENEGAVISLSTDLASDQTVYVDVNCDINFGAVSKASEYSLEIGTSAGTSGGGENYPDITPITPTGDGITTDQVVAPVLKKVYDDKVKVSSQNGKTLVYVVGRLVNSDNDLAAIKAAMEGLGYKTKKFISEQLVVTKGFKQLTFTTKTGSNKIEVKSNWVINWLWLGIIIGILVLIIVLIVVIIISRRKKGPKVESTPQTPTPVS